MGRHLLACTITLLLVAAGPSARADVLSPPPERCPEGSQARECHGPSLCAALSCETDDDCAATARCAERPLCARSVTCGGGWGGPGTPHTHVDGPCGNGHSCDGWGTSCQILKVCVPAASVDAGSSGLDAGSSAGDAGATRDAGEVRRDGGRRTDSGPSRQDAGGGGTNAGGCCSVVGAESSAGGALFAGLIIATALRRMRRRR